MSIEAISGASSLIPKIQTVTNAGDAPGEVAETEETPQVEPVEEGPASGETSGDDSDGESTDISGVLAHLRSGHFKGVAQVRLLANFHAELEALERQDILAAAEAQVSTFTTIVDAQLKTILTVLAAQEIDGEEDPLDEVKTPQTLTESLEAQGLTFEQAPEASEAGDDSDEVAEPAEVIEPAEALASAQESFDAAVADAFGAFNGLGDTDSATLSGDLQAAFDSLVESLNELSVSEPDPAPEGSEPSEAIASIEDAAVVAGIAASAAALVEDGQSTESVENTDAPPTAAEQYQALIDELGAEFSSALEDLAAAIEDAEFNPELTPPSGAGAAYDKFLAVYQDLQSAGDTTETDSSVEAEAEKLLGVDIEV